MWDGNARVQHLEDVKRDLAAAASSDAVQAALATERSLYTQVESTVRDVERQLVTVMARLEAEQSVVASLRASHQIHATSVGAGAQAQADAAAAPGGSTDGNSALLQDIDAKLARGQAQYADAVGLLRTEIMSKLDRLAAVSSPAAAVETQLVVQPEAAMAEVATAAAEQAESPAAPTPTAEKQEEEAAAAEAVESGEAPAVDESPATSAA
jgi:hypothetical protein